MGQAQIVLAGPPGVGKSTVARLVAEHLGRPAADLDDMITATHNKTPAEIIRNEGEPRFREVEAEVLEGLPANFGVVALGGGTLTTPRGRRAARRRGPVLGLTTSVDTIRTRLSASSDDRPLLDGDALETLLESRTQTYAAVDRNVVADGTPESVRDRIVESADETWVIEADVGGQTSRILVGRDLDDAIGGAVAGLEPTRTCLVVVDAGLPAERRTATLERIRAISPTPLHVVEVPGGEAVKTWTRLGETLEGALGAGCGRQSVVVGIGGGATCDFAGLAASLLGRGASLILVPTTVVAQVDASVGGKTAINLGGGRNLVGAFHPANEVIIDVASLDSLDDEEYVAGLAEALKIGIISDPDLFDSICAQNGKRDLTASQVAKAVQYKADIVRADPFERGRRKVLNLGHTLGHALESASDFSMKHGHGVAIGTAAVARLCAERGWCDTETRDRVLAGLEAVGLPTVADPDILARCAPYLRHDKKSDSAMIDLVTIQAMGKVCIEPVAMSDLAADLVRSGGAS